MNTVKNYGTCDLKYSKRLKELGVKQESLWYWQVYKTGDIYLLPHKDVKGFIDKVDVCKYYSAFTVAELGEALPWVVEGFVLAVEKCKDKWWVFYESGTGVLNGKQFDGSEANARAKMVIYLIENKLMEIQC